MGKGDCMVCCGAQKKEGKPTPCRQESICYYMSCDRCKAVEVEALYYGESARTCYLRGKEHLRGQASKGEENPLWKHDSTHHGGVQGSYSMGVIRKHKAPLSRQMHEATEIDCSKARIIMNSKAEYNGARVPRVTVEVGGKASIQQYRGSEPEPPRSGLPHLQVQGSPTQAAMEEEMETRSDQITGWEKEVKRSARSCRKVQVTKRSSPGSKDPQPQAKRIRSGNQRGGAWGQDQDLGKDKAPRPASLWSPPLELELVLRPVNKETKDLCNDGKKGQVWGQDQDLGKDTAPRPASPLDPPSKPGPAIEGPKYIYRDNQEGRTRGHDQDLGKDTAPRPASPLDPPSKPGPTDNKHDDKDNSEDNSQSKQGQRTWGQDQDLGKDKAPRPASPWTLTLEQDLDNKPMTVEVLDNPKDNKAVAVGPHHKAFSYGATDIRYRTVTEALMNPTGPKIGPGKSRKDKGPARLARPGPQRTPGSRGKALQKTPRVQPKDSRIVVGPNPPNLGRAARPDQGPPPPLERPVFWPRLN